MSGNLRRATNLGGWRLSPVMVKALSHVPRTAYLAKTRPRALLLGDHSRYHCGSAAVWDQLHVLAWRNGWHPTASKRDFDVVIVNGEGSMHHTSPHFRTKMQWLSDALEAGKPAYLVNTVWQENSNEYDKILSRLSGIVVREVLSQRDLRERHGICSTVSPDLSYFAQISRRIPTTNAQGADLATDFYIAAEQDWREAAYTKHTHKIRMRKTSWDSFIAGLRTARMLITGRHHAVYAACKAGIPFAAVESNTHKISGMIESSGAKIMIAKTVDELPAAIASARENPAEFQKLRKWLNDAPAAASLPSANSYLL